MNEHARWVPLISFQFARENAPDYSAREFEKLYAIVRAFEKIGRVVRITTDGSMLVLRGRR